MRTISEYGLDILKKFEGLRLIAYRCPAGVPTIGYGSTKYIDGTPVSINDTLGSEAEASKLLIQTLIDFELAVNTMLPNLNQFQYDALVSFSYNIGISAFSSSTLLKIAQVNSFDPQIKEEFMRWTIASGKRLPALQQRRFYEAKLYFSGSSI